MDILTLIGIVVCLVGLLWVIRMYYNLRATVDGVERVDLERTRAYGEVITKLSKLEASIAKDEKSLKTLYERFYGHINKDLLTENAEKTTQKAEDDNKSDSKDGSAFIKTDAVADTYPSFAVRLKNMRMRAGYSQAILARKLGITATAVNLWERGGGITDHNALELARVFNCSKEYLLHGTGNGRCHHHNEHGARPTSASRSEF